MKKTEIINFNEALKLDKSYFSNKIIIFPTDTVWGIGCVMQSKSSIENIYKIKKRDYSKPLAVLCADKKQLLSLVKNADEGILKKIICEFMPGALSVVTTKKEVIPDIVTSKLDTVALRIPKFKDLQELLNIIGAMPATSVNESGDIPINEINEVIDKYDGVVDIIIKPSCNTKIIEIPSTVISVEDKSYSVIREGAISKAEIDIKLKFE